jgi:hypothetical protein
MDYMRQQKAAAARANMLRLEAERLEKDAEFENARSDFEMYLGAMQSPPAPTPALPMTQPTPVQGDDGWSFGRVVGVTVLVVLALFTGAVWTEAGHRAGRAVRETRQADMQGSWGNSVPEPSSYRRNMPARSRMIVGGVQYEQ